MLCTRQDTGNVDVITSVTGKPAVRSLFREGRRCVTLSNQSMVNIPTFYEFGTNENPTAGKFTSSTAIKGPYTTNASLAELQSAPPTLKHRGRQSSSSSQDGCRDQVDFSTKFPFSQSQVSQLAADQELEQDPFPHCTIMRSFKISNEEMVKRYLYDKFMLLQQQANKRIAKAWIKGICPKKQARFPYQNKQRKQTLGLNAEVPEWWPIEVSPFTEPDHINKDGKSPCEIKATYQ